MKKNASRAKSGRAAKLGRSKKSAPKVRVTRIAKQALKRMKPALKALQIEKAKWREDSKKQDLERSKAVQAFVSDPRAKDLTSTIIVGHYYAKPITKPKG